MILMILENRLSAASGGGQTPKDSKTSGARQSGDTIAAIRSCGRVRRGGPGDDGLVHPSPVRKCRYRQFAAPRGVQESVSQHGDECQIRRPRNLPEMSSRRARVVYQIADVAFAGSG